MRYDAIQAGADEFGGERRLRDLLVLLAVFGTTFLAFGVMRLIG